MLVNWSKFIPALLLLLTPVAILHGKNVRHRAVVRGWEGYWSRVLLLWSHPLDFARAALGGWWLAEALRAPDGHGMIRYAPFFIQAGVLIVASALQTLICKEPESAHAPFAFVAGLILGYLPHFLSGYAPFLTAGFALLLAVVLTRGVNAPAAFFPILALAVVALGVLFAQKKLLWPLAALAPALGIPWLLTLLFPRDLVVSYLAKPAATAGKP